MAITSQTKGLLGFALPILVIGAYSCLRDGWRELAARLLHGPLGARVAWLVDRNRWLFNWRSVVAIPLGFAVYYCRSGCRSAMTGSHQGLEWSTTKTSCDFSTPSTIAARSIYMST